MVFRRLLFSKSSSPFYNPLVTVPKITSHYWYNHHLHVPKFFNSLTRYLSFILISFSIILWLAGTTIFIILQVLCFWLLILRSCRLAEIWSSACMSKFNCSLCKSISSTDIGLCIYQLFVWSNWNVLHNSQWITLPTLSCLVLYSLCVNLLHSLIMWLLVSSRSAHNPHLLFYCVLSILDLIWLVLMALFCAASRRDFVSLWRFVFLCHIQAFLCEMLLISRLKCP